MKAMSEERLSEVLNIFQDGTFLGYDASAESGVFAGHSVDAHHTIIYTHDGQSLIQTIFLDPPLVEALLTYLGMNPKRYRRMHELLDNFVSKAEVVEYYKAASLGIEARDIPSLKDRFPEVFAEINAARAFLDDSKATE